MKIWNWLDTLRKHFFNIRNDQRKRFWKRPHIVCFQMISMSSSIVQNIYMVFMMQNFYCLLVKLADISPRSHKTLPHLQYILRTMATYRWTNKIQIHRIIQNAPFMWCTHIKMAHYFLPPSDSLDFACLKSNQFSNKLK